MSLDVTWKMFPSFAPGATNHFADLPFLEVIRLAR